MRKYQYARFQPQMIFEGYMRGYYCVADVQANCKVVASGFLSEQDAYDAAYWLNEDDQRKHAATESINKLGQEWLDLSVDC